MTKRAAIYARQSLDRNGEGDAVARQVDDCRRLAELRGWTIVDTYTDNDASATKGPRPEYDRLVANVEVGQVDVVLAWAVDRIGRRLAETAAFIDLCQRHGVVVVTVSGDLDLSTPSGRTVAGILASVAQGEAEQKGARQRRANRQRAEAGDIGWTRRPYGYDRRGGRVVLVETEAAVLRDAANRLLSGGTLAGIVRDMNAKGLTTTAGGPWSVTTLRRLLLSPRHAGLAVYRRGEHITTGTWPAVFDLDTHERLTQVLKDPRRRTAPTVEPKYLLSGLAVCGRRGCGKRLFASPMGRPGGYWMVYRCLTSHLARRMDLVDEVVEGMILARLGRPDAAALLVPRETVDVDALRAEAVELRDRRDELAALRAEGLVTAAGLRESLERIRGRLAGIEQEIRDATGGDAALAALVTAEDVTVVWAGLTLRQKRAVIDTLATVTILPAPYKGARFVYDQVRVEPRRSPS